VHATLDARAFVARLPPIRRGPRSWATRWRGRGCRGPCSAWGPADLPAAGRSSARVFALQDTGEFDYAGRNGMFCFATPPGNFVATSSSSTTRRSTTTSTRRRPPRSPRSRQDRSAPAGADRAVVPRRGQPGCAMGWSVAYRFTGRPDVDPARTCSPSTAANAASSRQRTVAVRGVPLFATPVPRDGACQSATDVALHRLWKPFGVSNTGSRPTPRSSPPPSPAAGCTRGR